MAEAHVSKITSVLIDPYILDHSPEERTTFADERYSSCNLGLTGSFCHKYDIGTVHPTMTEHHWPALERAGLAATECWKGGCTFYR